MRTLLSTIVMASLLSPAATGEDQPGTPALQNVAAAIADAMHQHHYDPAALADPAYLAVEQRVAVLAAQAESRQMFVSGFNAIWRDGPFSHVDLRVARASAVETAAYLDALRVGEGARLSWVDDIAILTVTTMMGQDTIEQIEAAYASIGERDTRALVIDLRENAGGAFAVRPLVGHLIDQPLSAGAFVAQQWASEENRPPTVTDIASVAPWQGWTLTAFWNDVQEAPITRIEFPPLDPRFDGPVYALTSRRTASAAEMAADALQSAGRAVLVGEKTAGRMLSQKPFDLPEGLQLFLPIADYYSLQSGRIEGRGVTPDIEVAADAALAEALHRLRSRVGGAEAEIR